MSAGSAASVVSHSAALWTVARQAPLSMAILQARSLEWVAILLQGIFLTQGLNLGLRSPALAGRFFFFNTSTTWEDPYQEVAGAGFSSWAWPGDFLWPTGPLQSRLSRSFKKHLHAEACSLWLPRDPQVLDNETTWSRDKLSQPRSLGQGACQTL